MKITSFLLVLAVFCCPKITSAQQNIGIGTNSPNSSSLLDISSNAKGLLIPRVSLTSITDITTIPSPANSLLVYNNNPALPDGSGFYYFSSVTNEWVRLATNNNLSNINYWSFSGNNGTNPSLNFIGTTDNKALVFKTNNFLSGKIDPIENNHIYGYNAGNEGITGVENTLLGGFAGNQITTGSNNLFAGFEAGNAVNAGSSNVFVGHGAGRNKAIGNKNVALGFDALSNGYFGANYNIAIGYEAGKNAGNSYRLRAGGGVYIGTAAGYNATGGIAIGDSSCKNCATVTGYVNIGIGHFSLLNNTTGDKNTAIGMNSLSANTLGSENTAIGFNAMIENTTGMNNVAIGYNNSLDNTTGFRNSSVGSGTLKNNTTGENNTALGFAALSANTIGDRNTAIGVNAGPLNNNFLNTTCLGYEARASTGNTMVFGNDIVNRWAFGLTTTGAGKALEVGDAPTNGNGAFLTHGGTWTNTSDMNKKENFSDLDTEQLMKKISELRIQKWRYKETNEYHIGPVAQQFYQLFQVGEDEKGISTIDPAGIALAAIQQLMKENNDLRNEITQIKLALEELKNKR